MLIFSGLLILLIPYLVVLIHPNRIRALLGIIVSQAAFLIFLALVTQFFHIFTYPAIISANIVVAVISVLYVWRHRRQYDRYRTANPLYKRIFTRSGDYSWLIILAFIIIVIQLSSVHFSYTGDVDATRGVRYESHSFYPYPTMSDEWVAVANMNYSIESRSLPLHNPLWPEQSIHNYLAPYFSGLAAVFLSLSVAPIYGMAYAAIFAGTLICLLIYLILRRVGCGQIASSVAILSIPYIANSGNLPGIWILIPYVASTIFLLIAIYAYVGGVQRSPMLAISASLVALIIYPPMIVFVAPLLVGAHLGRRIKGRLVFNSVLILIGIIAVPMILSASLAGSGSGWLKIILTLPALIIRPVLSGGIVSYGIWNVIPWILLPFALAGIWRAYKMKLFNVLAPLFVGLIFWVTYAYVEKVFIIEYPRIVIITSLLLIVLAGIGLEYAGVWFQKRFKIEHDHPLHLVASIIILATFVMLTIDYPILIKWDRFPLTVRSPGGDEVVMPAPLVNRFLTEDDLRFFSGITGARFIAPAWKGLVLGVATRNYPLESRASTLANKFLTYNDFMLAKCPQKSILAVKFEIEYVYSRPFECPDFTEIGLSQESLHLYHFGGN